MLHAVHGLSRISMINKKGIYSTKSVDLLFRRGGVLPVACCQLDARFVQSMHGFPVITMHLGDQTHYIAGFREAVSSCRTCMKERDKARAGVQS